MIYEAEATRNTAQAVKNCLSILDLEPCTLNLGVYEF